MIILQKYPKLVISLGQIGIQRGNSWGYNGTYKQQYDNWVCRAMDTRNYSNLNGEKCGQPLDPLGDRQQLLDTR